MCMANMLKEAGEEVALLVLFDTISQFGRQSLPLGLWLKKIGAPRGFTKLKAVKR